MAAVTLDIPRFRAWYPRFGNVTNDALEPLFELACMGFDNSDFSLESNLDKRERLLYLLLAHLAYGRYGDADGHGGGGAVGRIGSATEGSVSVSFDMGAGLPFDTVWYMQSEYGQLFWQLTKPYRLFAYFPGETGGARCVR